MKRLFLFLFTLILLTACGGQATIEFTPEATPPVVAPTETAVLTHTTAPPTPIAETPTAGSAAEEAPPTPTAVPTNTPPPTATPLPTLAGSVSFEQVLAGGSLARPTYLTHAGDERLFIVEQPGRIRIIAGGALLPAPFLDIANIVQDGANEQGLLSVAFHPDYAQNGRFFINYTRQDGATVIARYRVSDDPNVADPASEQILLTIAQPYNNHNGGQLKFGPDGLLYVGMGDGGSAGDPQQHGQNPATLLGSMLRLDVNYDEPPYYAIPASNPFAGSEDARGEAWAFGLRNPWRFSFDRLTGDLFIADVGQNAWEEINFQPASSSGGENYGWRCYEGTHEYNLAGCDGVEVVGPIFEYNHSQGCSITGGYVYRGAAFPALSGNYFLTDYCSGIVWALAPQADGVWASAQVANTGRNVASFGEDVNGELYILGHADGAVLRLVGE